jgi:hypothetical protein
MQIRYLEAMQAMAKSANSKVIFLPAPGQTISQAMATADSLGEGPSRYQNDYHESEDGFQRALRANVVENI